MDGNKLHVCCHPRYKEESLWVNTAVGGSAFLPFPHFCGPPTVVGLVKVPRVFVGSPILGIAMAHTGITTITTSQQRLRCGHNKGYLGLNILGLHSI